MHVGDRHGPLHLELAQAVACEDGVGTGERVGELDDVADADVGQGQIDRLSSIVDARFEIALALALEYLQLHVMQARHARAIANDVQLRDDPTRPVIGSP